MADDPSGNGARILAFPGMALSPADLLERAKREAEGAAQTATQQVRQNAESAVEQGRKVVQQAQQLADAGKPPDVLVQAIREFTARPAVQAELRAIGVRGADAAVDTALRAVFRKAAPSGKPTPKPNPWMTGVVHPIADPVLVGFKGQLATRAKPYVRKAALIAGGTALGLFLLGRWSARA